MILDLSFKVFLEFSPRWLCYLQILVDSCPLSLDANALSFSFKVSESLLSANREGTDETALPSRVPHFNLIFSLPLSNSNVTPLFLCMGRILMYTSSASFKTASVSLKSKAFSTSGNYLWNPLTWLVHNAHPVEGSREKREGKIF